MTYRLEDYARDLSPGVFVCMVTQTYSEEETAGTSSLAAVSSELV